MSLLRLLTAGKSLVGLQRPASRYQMREHYRLPKFGSGRNPFAAPAPAPEEDVQIPGEPESRPERSHVTAVAEAPATREEARPLPVRSPAETSASTSSLPGGTVAQARVGLWTHRLNPLSWFSRRQAAPRPAIPRFSKVPVQGELSLDRVKVVRNDLNEADVEIIAAKPVPKAKPASAAPAGKTMELLPT